MLNTDFRNLHQKMANTISEAINKGIPPYAVKLILDDLSRQCDSLAHKLEQQEAQKEQQAANDNKEDNTND